MTSTTWTPSTITTGYTNLGSLGPTSFPADCLESLWDFQTSPLLSDIYTYVTQGCAVSSCCPSERFYTDSWAWMTSYFSPGVCPSQYRSCSPPPATAQTVLSSQPGETIVFCCPTNYACPYTIPPSGYGDPYFLFCQSLMYGTTSAVVMDNIFDQSTVSTSSFAVPTTQAGRFNLVYPIQIRIGTTSIPQTSAPESSQTRSQTSPITNNGTPTPSHRISTGAQVGIGVGVAVGALLLGALASYLFVRRRMREKKHGTVSQLDSREKGGIHEILGEGVRIPPTELSSKEAPRAQLDSTPPKSRVYEVE